MSARHDAIAILDRTPYTRCVDGIAPTDTLFAYVWAVWPDSGLPAHYALLTVEDTRLKLITVDNSLPVGEQTRRKYYPLEDAERLGGMMARIMAHDVQ